MKKVLLFMSLILGTTINSLTAQSFFTSDDCLINGYAVTTHGLDYEYQSCIPGLRQSILVRATSGNVYLEWETDPVPSTII